MRIHVQDLTRDEAYWDGVHNADYLNARELAAAEREKETIRTHLTNAQHLLSKYAQEIYSLEEELRRTKRNRLFIFLYGQLSVLVAYGAGLWL